MADDELDEDYLTDVSEWLREGEEKAAEAEADEDDDDESVEFPLAPTMEERLESVDISLDEPNLWRDEETLRQLYWDEGFNQKDVAKALGCSFGTVQKWMKKLGVETRGGDKKLSKRKPKEYLKQQLETIRDELDDLEAAIDNLD